MKPIVLSSCALFSTVTLQTFLDILDNDLMKKPLGLVNQA